MRDLVMPFGKFRHAGVGRGLCEDRSKLQRSNEGYRQVSRYDSTHYRLQSQDGPAIFSVHVHSTLHASKM
jgi:hypothetical protein